MCDPITIAAVAGGIGTITSAFGGVASANAQAAQAEQQAALDDRQQQIEATRSSFQRRRVQGRVSQAIGQTRAAAAERGLFESGSVIDSADNTAREAAMDLEAIRFGSEAEQGNLRFQAASSRANASAARTGGMIGAFGTLAGGASQMFTTLASPYQRNRY